MSEQDSAKGQDREQQLRAKMSHLYDEYAAAEKELAALEDQRFRVCIFGSARIGPQDATYKMVRGLARTLASLGIDIVTGGGPGLMEAANRGEGDAHADGVMSIGLPILLPHRHEPANSHLDIKSEHRRFSTRLDEFMRLSHAVIVAPGGIGTLLELSYVWQLVQVQLVEPRPIVLLGREFWGGLLQWMHDQQLRRKFIAPQDLEIVHLADTRAEVLEIIKPELQKFQDRRHQEGQHGQAEEARQILEQVDQVGSQPEHQEPMLGTKE